MEDDGVSGDEIGCLGDMARDMEDVFDIVRGEDSGDCLDWVDSLLLKLRLVGLVAPSEGGGFTDTRILAIPRGRSLIIC